MTRQLLSFSRRQSLSPRVVDAVRCVYELKDVLRQSVRGDIRIDLDLPDRILPVLVDPNELEMALLNLIVNARDAMPDGGTIRISVRTSYRQAPSVEESVLIQVEDTGKGIPDEIRDHVFEPYFTTKNLDRGTGLGLSQVYGFAKQSNGDVQFQSRPGSGTVFTIVLPCSRDAVQEMPRVEALPGDKTGLRVLLVEDNPEVRLVASDYLDALGCKVVTAESAERAIELLTNSDPFDVMLSDIAMPGMNGVELARLVNQRYPKIRVVLATGYSDKAAEAIADGYLILQKPYTRDNLRDGLAQDRIMREADG